MKFVLGKKRLYWWPVVVRLPDLEKPGKMDEQIFEMEFELLDRAEYDRLAKASLDQKSAEEKIKLDDAFIKRVCQNWRDIVDEDGADVAFADQALDAALQSNAVRAGILRAIIESANGEEARIKN